MKKHVLSTLLGLFLIQCAISGFSQPLNGLPENARVELKGTLQVFIRENFEEQTAEYEYFLERGKGKGPVKLIFLDDHPSQLRSGVGIAVRGMVRKGNIEVTAANIEEGTNEPGSGSGSAQAFTLDERSALVVIVEVPGFTHSSTDLANMEGYYFGDSNSMADMYEQITFGQLMISGQVVGPITVSQSAEQVCDNPFLYASTWLSQAESQFGVNPGAFRHRIFAVPRSLAGTGCGWTGYANVGCGNSCNAFNRWSHDINTTSHEFGHNISLAHSGVGTSQYADYSSFMGYSTTRGVRALDGAHHWQTGWYENLDILNTVTIQTSGNYEVAPLTEGAPASNAPSIYRIEIAGEDDYFLSARVAQGYDTGLNALNSEALTGVNIHRYAGSGYDQTLRVAQLSNNGYYTDTINNLTITQLSRADDGTVSFSVDFGEGECVESAPSLSMNPTFATVGPEGSYDFPITLTNNDSAFCSARTFALDTNMGSLSPQSLTNLAPGGQGGSSLTLTGGTVDGETQATVSVETYASTAQVTAFLSVDATPPTVSALSGTYERKGKNHRVQLSWNGSDESGIASYQIFRDGASSAIATTNQASYTDSLPRSLSTSYDYQVVASDIHGNSAASGTITVSTGSSDDGGGGGGNDKPCRGKNCSR